MGKKSKKENVVYEDKAKRVQRKLSLYSSRSVMNFALEYLAMEVESEFGRMVKKPWVVMLLLKWSFLNSKESGRDISKSRFHEIAQEIYSMQHSAFFNRDQESISFHIQVRPLLLQQISYQESRIHQLFNLFRQSYWFVTSAGTTYYQDRFFELTNVSLKDYFFVSNVLARLMAGSQVKFNKFSLAQLIYHLCPTVSIKTLLNYLKLVSFSVSTVKSFLEPFRLKDAPVWEYFEDTPFLIKPIYVDGGNCFVIDEDLFISSACNLVPEILKAADKELFKINFGDTLERYIGSLIHMSGIPSKNEHELKSILGKKGKVVDFALGQNLNILVDSKAIEPTVLIKTSTDIDIIYSRLEGSFIKGIWQGQECASRLKAALPSAMPSKMIIVTHKDYFITSGQYVADHIRPALMSEATSKFGSLLIDFADIRYCTISDLELMLAATKEGVFEIDKFLDYCKEKDSNHLSSRINLRHHLEDYLNGSMVSHYDFLKDLGLSEFDLVERIKFNKKQWGSIADNSLLARTSFLMSEELSA